MFFYFCDVRHKHTLTFLHFTFRNGNFILAYKVSHPSTYNIDVSMVTGGGLIGKYFKNETSFKNDTPDYVVASEQISFNNRRLNDNRLFSYARWMGYLSFPHTTSFQIEIIGIEGKCKLLIGDEVVIDTNEDSSIGRFRAYEHVLYEMIIEYSMVREHLVLLTPFMSVCTVQPNLNLLSSYRISIVSCCSYYGYHSRIEEK